jgi:hypothetical protein
MKAPVIGFGIVLVVLAAVVLALRVQESHQTAQAAAPSTSATSWTACYFPAGDPFAAAVATAAVDPNSEAYITSLQQAGDTADFYASTGVENVNVATDSTPRLTLKPKVSYHGFPVPYPWRAGFLIEPLSDAHAMVLDPQCHLFESYQTTYGGGVLSAYSGADWDTKANFKALAPGNPSAMASGLSLYAGMVQYSDYTRGFMHPLNIAVVAGTACQYKFVWPASDTDQLPFKGTGICLPYGARLRLKPSFSTEGWGPQAAFVAETMKRYGVYVADTGASENAVYFDSGPWTKSDLASLGKMHLSDFDVLTLPAIQTVPGH